MNQDQYTMGNLFERTDCISQEVLLRYVQGQLSKPALRQVEMHLIDCELCSDAVEGALAAGPVAFERMLQNVGDRIVANNASAASDDTDNVIEFRPQVNPPAATANSSKRSPFAFIGIAASVALLATFAFFFLGGDSASSIADRHFKTFPGSPSRTADSATSTSIFDQADERYLAKDYEGAAKLYDQLTVPSALYQAGNCYYQLGKYDLAAARFQSVIDMGQSWTEYAEFNLAMANLKLERIPDAKTVLERIVATPGHAFSKQATQALEDLQSL